MIEYHKTDNNQVIAELTDQNYRIFEVQDALDLISGLGDYDCNRIIIREQNLSSDFFDLKTRLAGEILQKFSNYRVKLAIVGDFSQYKNSKSFQDFVRESNRGNLIYFTDSFESAINNLKIK